MKKNSSNTISADATVSDVITSASVNDGEIQAETPSKPAGIKGVIDKIISVLKSKPVKIGVPVLIFLSAFVVVAYYIFFPSRGYFHSDCTDTIMWAEVSVETNSLYDDLFTYACLIPFGMNLVYIPLIKIFGLSMAAQLTGMFIFLVFFSSSLFFVLKQMKWKFQWIAVAEFTMLFTVSTSDKLREIFWGHTIYYSLGILFVFVGLGLLFKVFNLYEKYGFSFKEKSGKKICIFSVLLFVWFFLCSINQIMAITIFAVPVMGAMFIERFLDVKKNLICRENIFYGVLLLGMAVATLGGYFFANVLSGDIVAGYEEGFSKFSSPDDWLQNFQKFPHFWMTLLGLDIKAGDDILSADGIKGLMKIVASLLLVIIPVFGLIFYPKINDKFTKIVVLVHWIVFALIMMGFTFGYLSAANWRLSPIVCTSVLATFAVCKWILDGTDAGRFGLLLLVPQICVSIFAGVQMAKMEPDYGTDKGLYMLAEYLEECGLEHGYATFWNANAVTLISDNKVKIRNVNVDEYGVHKYVYQNSERWYNDVPGEDAYFLVLSPGEYDTLSSSQSQFLDTALDFTDLGGYKIYVFRENIV